MITCNLDSVLSKYKSFRDEHCGVITELNQFRKEIRFLKQFGEFADIQIIQMLYQTDKDIPDIAEILGISECEVYFLMSQAIGKGDAYEGFNT